MKTKKLPAKKSSGSSKRGIIVKGEWKAVNLDPGLFSDEGMEGLVCFEELTDYSLVEPEKTAIADKSVKMTGKERKKRKANEIEAEEELASEADATEVDVDDKPAKKKKKKKKGSKKDDSSQTASSVDQNIKTVEDEGGRDQIVEVGSPDVTSDQQDQTSGTAKTQSKLSKKEKKKQKRKKKKKTASKEAKLQAEAIDSNAQTEHVGKVNPQSKKKAKNWTDAALADSKGQDTDVSAWKDLFVPEPVLKALSKLGFSAPTPIQALTLPSAVRDHLDVLGAAETGSGKTLSFGIPMIHTILEWRKASNCKTDQGSKPDSVSDLESIYMPLDGIPNNNNNEENDTTEENKEKNNGNDDDCRITVNDSSVDDQSQVNEVCSEACVTDDVSDINDNKKQATEKQPLLGLVLTPTRELAVQVKHHIDAAAQFTGIKTAIVVGGMAPQKQQRMLMRRPEIVIATPGRLWEMIKERHPHLQNLRQLRCLVIDEADRMVEKGHFAELENLLEMLNTSQFNPKRQTFVFSATLTMIHSMPVRLYQKKGKKLEQRSKLELLMEKVGIKDKPKVVDLTRKEATVETLMETKIICTKEEKDFYLYYFLLQYPGRTMVFANSIDCIKRLNSLLVILDCNPLPLHANMHQKQRLKNLERFAEMESCVLLTTDVAARGLDIPNVQHVIHYQVPRTSETYVHRSGRTARATKEGLSLLLIGPDDMINFKKICRTLGKDEDLPAFPVETNCMAAIKERVTLARKIEKIEYFHGREKQHNSWVRQAAEAMDIDVDDDLLLGRGKDENDEREQQKLVKGLKKQLKHLTSQPVFRNEMKTKYPTQMGKLNLPQLPIFKADTAITSVTNHRLALKMKRKQKH